MIEPEIAALADALAAAEKRERTNDDITQAYRIVKCLTDAGYSLTEV